MQNGPDFARLAQELDQRSANEQTAVNVPDENPETPDLEAGLAALASQLGGEDSEAADLSEPSTLSPEQQALTPGHYLQHGEPGLTEVGGGDNVEAMLGGAAKSVFETGDFLFGETPLEDRSAIREAAEDRTDALKNRSMVAGFSAGVGQFAMGIFGAGKVVGGLKMVPWFGRGLGALGNVRGATTAGEMAKAATVGAVVYDPHEERLANLVQETPFANFVTEWLAADPEDTAAEGRMKAALESIGMDLAIIGLFAKAGTAWKWGRLGNEEKMRGAVEEAEADVQRAIKPANQNIRAITADNQNLSRSRGIQGSVEALPESGSLFTLPKPDGTVPIAANRNGPSGILRADNETTSAKSDGNNALNRGDAADGYATMGTPAKGKRLTPQAANDDAMPVAPRPEPVSDNAKFGPEPTRTVRSGGELPPEKGAGSQAGQSSKAVPEKGLKVEPSIPVQVTSNPTEAAASQGVNLQGTPTPTFTPSITYGTDDTLAVLNGSQRDADAIEAHGGWYQAIQAGHVFGRGEGIPYRKLNQDADVDDFMARAADAVEERLNTIKGGAVLTDASVTRMVQQRARLFGEDPAMVMGQLQQTGEASARMVADMEAGYLITHRMFQDTNALAQRINAGDFTGFGSKDAAVEALKGRLSLASSIYGASRSITANAGRAMRRMRADFKLRPEDLQNLQDMDGNQLVQMIVNTKGDPKALAHAANPAMWKRFVNAAEFVYVNNLVSGPWTQAVNIMSNSAMVGIRPLERLLGGGIKAAAGNPEGRTIVAEAAKQYAYTGSAFIEGFSLAVKTLRTNDSILAPFGTEYYRPNQMAAEVGPNGFKPWTSTANITHNALNAAFTAIGVPTRTLGFVDELVKQTVYRSKVQAKAHVEAVTEGVEAGLEGPALKRFVADRVDAALSASFDDMGRGIEPQALREAQVATFQQDIPEDAVLGKVGQYAQRTIPGFRLILPFVKTPTNILRYGWKLSPGLNLLQVEYRKALSGLDGPEAQAQAYGQMALGVSFLGAAATLAANGMITGGGPSDPKLRQELQATGWRPYSFVRTREDGSKAYHAFGRMDPVAVPFGIVADLQDMMEAFGKEEEDRKGALDYVSSGIGALAVGLTKQFRDKTYLKSLSDTLEAIAEPEDRMSMLGGQMAANFVPFSAFLRQTNVGDPYLREARTYVDRMKANVPGLSETVPPRYDAFGDPVIARRGGWSTDSGEAVDAEMQRLILQNGASILRVNPRPQAGVDLRDITMADGSNAYAAYQRLSGHLPGEVSLKSIVADVIATEEYRSAPDGDRATKGTKLWILEGPVQRYRDGAMKMMRADPNVREALEKRQLKVLREYEAMNARGRSARKEPGLAELGAAFGVDLEAAGAGQ